MTTTIIESGPRHPHRQHADRRARRPARPLAGLPDPRPGRPLSRARLRLPALPLGRGADRGRGGAALDPRRPHRARLRLQDRDARPRHPRRRRPARRGAVRPRRRGRLRALLPDDRRGGRRGARAPRAGEEAPEPVRLDVPVDAYLPATFIPFEAAKIDVHRRIVAAREPGELRAIRDELSDRFGPPPPQAENLLTLQRARIELGLAGARSVEFRGGRLSVTGVELDSEQAGVLARAGRGGALRVARADRVGPSRPTSRRRDWRRSWRWLRPARRRSRDRQSAEADLSLRRLLESEQFELCCPHRWERKPAQGREVGPGYSALRWLGLRRALRRPLRRSSRSPRGSAIRASPPATSRWSTHAPRRASARSREARVPSDALLQQVGRRQSSKQSPKPGDKKYEELKETSARRTCSTRSGSRAEAEEMGITVTPKEDRQRTRRN